MDTPTFRTQWRVSQTVYREVTCLGIREIEFMHACQRNNMFSRTVDATW